MKTLITPRATFMLLLSLLTQLLTAGGSVMGKVTDADTKEAFPFITVVFDCQGTQKVFTTNESGYYYASNIPAGTYTITVAYMSNKVQITDFKLANDEDRVQDIVVGASIKIKDMVYETERFPIINPVDPTGVVLDRKGITNEPITSVKEIQEMLGGGAIAIGGELYVRGARAGATAYYIDGCRVMGNPDIPLCGLDLYRSYNGFIPPKYGDATGAVIVMETRNYFSEHR